LDEKKTFFPKTLSLGYPASQLMESFNDDVCFFADAPVLQTFVANPNHIGCHNSLNI
jgi:hypothetical protein